jgi:hypothetical protein
LYNTYKKTPLIFKKYLNKLLRDDPIYNVFLLAQHLQKLNEEVEKYNKSDYEKNNCLLFLT